MGNNNMTTNNESNSESSAGAFDKPLILFFALAFALAWGVLGFFKIIADQSGMGTLELLNMAENLDFGTFEPTLPGWLLYFISRIADFAFSIAGLIMIYSLEGKEGLRSLWQRLMKWKFYWGWYLLALLPLGLYLVATLLANANDSSIFESAAFNASILRNLLFSVQGGFFVSLFLRGAMGEELGLRGFALPRLQSRMSPFRASVVIGALWGVWHIPVLLGRDVVSIVAFLILTFGLTFMFTLLFNGSGGSLIPGLLFHALQNWEEGFETIFPGLLNIDWELPSTLLTLVVGIVAGVLVWRKGRK